MVQFVTSRDDVMVGLLYMVDLHAEQWPVGGGGRKGLAARGCVLYDTIVPGFKKWVVQISSWVCRLVCMSLSG
jgi:hypothetical protein